MQRRRRRRPNPRNIFVPRRRYSRPLTPLPRGRDTGREILEKSETDLTPEENEPRFPKRPTIEDVESLVREVVGERKGTNIDIEGITAMLIKPTLVEIMTEPEAKGLGLLVGELGSDLGVKNWTIPELGVICTEFEGVTILIDVNATIEQRIQRANFHLQLYVSSHWHPGWREDAIDVCLVGKGATASDFVFTTVMVRNNDSINLYFQKTDLFYSIRRVRKRIRRDKQREERQAVLNLQRQANEKETGIRETDCEREVREREEERARQIEIQMESERTSNEKETGIWETDDERRLRERLERERRSEMERLHRMKVELEKELESQRVSNMGETGIRETDEERKDREAKERWERKVSGWNRTVIYELEGLESRITQSPVLSRDSELRRRVAEIRGCISNDMWWAAYSSLGLATKRISHIEEQ